MIMKTHKLLWKILFSNQKSGVYSVLSDLGSLFLLQNIISAGEGLLYLLKFQAVKLHLY